jgi:hypothetical protein
MAVYLILGAGRFGRLALARLARQDASAGFVMVDNQPRALAAARNGFPDRVTWVESDALAFLKENLGKGGPWDWLIPMVPFHVAFGWLWQGPLAAGGWEILEVPEIVGELCPTAQRGPQGELYLSLAQHLCPDDCQEPEVCPVSGEDRRVPLYERLAGLPVDGFSWRIIVSRQLAPGVGGYSPRRLTALARDLAGYQGKVLLATACRCHGVVHALARGKGGGR